MNDFNFDPVDGLENATTFIQKPLNPRENFMRLFNQLKTYINGALKTVVDNKVDKVVGKNLSDVNYTVVDQTALGNKVDKVVGKGLSEDNYTLVEKTKLSDIAISATRVIVTSGTEVPSGGSSGDIYIQYI